MKSVIKAELPFVTSQYMITLEPHEALGEEIRQLKKDFAAKYDCPAAAKGKPGITIARFEQYEMVEQRIIHRLQVIVAAQAAFGLELHDFGSHPTHSIFLNVTTQVKIVELVRSIRAMQQLLTIDKDHKVHFIKDPNIIIARKLLPWQYEKGWLELSNTHFSGRFIADQVLLHRKREGEIRYTVIGKCKMMNLRTETRQGQLF